MSANSVSNLLIEGSAQPIELSWSSQRLALRDRKEDWTGITNPAERRKLQNRINQRARRERARKRNSRETSATTERSASQEDEDSNPVSLSGHAAGSQSSQGSGGSAAITIKRPQPRRCMAAVPEVRALMNRFADHAYASYVQGEPAIAHLPLLVRYNVATSLARIATLLGMDEEFYRWDGVSPMNKQGPLLGSNFRDHFMDWPATLKPTALQISIEHHPWVDCFPWPQLRDNLLRAFEQPDLCDEDELCHDICDLSDDRETMLIIWGSPEDPNNWEVTDEFLQKWAWLLKGCGQVLRSTNYWRLRRGEAPITPQQSGEWVRLSLPKRLRPSDM